MSDAERNAVIEECAAFIVQKAAALDATVAPSRFHGVARDGITDILRTIALTMRAELKR